MGGVFSSFRFGEKEEREEEIAAEELRASMAEKRSLCNGSASNARVELGFSAGRCIVYGLHLEPIISPN